MWLTTLDVKLATILTIKRCHFSRKNQNWENIFILQLSSLVDLCSFYLFLYDKSRTPHNLLLLYPICKVQYDAHSQIPFCSLLLERVVIWTDLNVMSSWTTLTIVIKFFSLKGKKLTELQLSVVAILTAFCTNYVEWLGHKWKHYGADRHGTVCSWIKATTITANRQYTYLNPAVLSVKI